MAVVLLLGIAAPARADDVELLSAGVRARVGEKRVLGTEQPESFHQYDLVATFRLPWQRPFAAGLGLGARLLASAGVLEGAGKAAPVASLIPVLAIGAPDVRCTLDLGAGLALLGRHRYAQQDFGGPLQFALTAGFGVLLHPRIGIGYRYLHYSDARAYGRGTIGADFHMIELIYRL